MFNRLKNLFRRQPAEPLMPAGAANPGRSTAPANPPASFRRPQPGPKRGSAQPATPALRSQAPEPAAGSPHRPTAPAGAEERVQISLASIVATLPDWLASRVQQKPGANTFISIPLEAVVSQLSQGVVRVSFGELRAASPKGVFSDASDQDQAAVQMPLHEILSQIPADRLPKRSGQRRVEIPDEVVPLFGPKGEPLTRVTRSNGPLKQAGGGYSPGPGGAAGIPHEASSPAGSGGTVVYPSLAKLLQTAPPAGGQPAAPRTPSPVASSPAPAVIRPTVPLPTPPTAKAPTIPAPIPAPAAPAAPMAPSIPAAKPSVGPPTGAQPPLQAAPLPPTPMARVAAAPAPTRPTPSPDSGPVGSPVSAPAPSISELRLPFKDIAGGLAEPVRSLLQGGISGNAQLVLPGSEVEEGLKRGKVVFPLQRLITLFEPPFQGSIATEAGGQPVELPLAIVAPAFLASRRPAASQKKVTIGEAIPDVFQAKSGIAVPGGAAVATPATASSAASVAPQAGGAPAPSAAAAAPAVPAIPREIGEVFGQPGRKNWTPMELVQRTANLPGVAGALIAMQDGLLVANQMPPGLSGETISAFIPQMYSRIMQYCKELKFNEAESFTFIVDAVPMRISKVGGVYFAVLGRSGETLPEPHLGIIAAHLAPQNK